MAVQDGRVHLQSGEAGGHAVVTLCILRLMVLGEVCIGCLCVQVVYKIHDSLSVGIIPSATIALFSSELPILTGSGSLGSSR